MQKKKESHVIIKIRRKRSLLNRLKPFNERKIFGGKKWKYGKNSHATSSRQKKSLICLIKMRPKTSQKHEYPRKSVQNHESPKTKPYVKKREKIGRTFPLYWRHEPHPTFFFFTPFKHQISPESSYFGPKRFKLTLILRHGWVLGELRARKRRKRQTSRRIEHENASFFAAQVVKWRQ